VPHPSRRRSPGHRSGRGLVGAASEDVVAADDQDAPVRQPDDGGRLAHDVDGAGERPGVGRRVVDLGALGRRGRAVAADDEHAPVGQRHAGAEGPCGVHVGRRRPGVGRAVVDLGRRQPVVEAAAALAARDEHAPVAQRHRDLPLAGAPRGAGPRPVIGGRVEADRVAHAVAIHAAHQQHAAVTQRRGGRVVAGGVKDPGGMPGPEAVGVCRRRDERGGEERQRGERADMNGAKRQRTAVLGRREHEWVKA
jgi:hypothetical protein